jgi:hypothetical protein
MSGVVSFVGALNQRFLFLFDVGLGILRATRGKGNVGVVRLIHVTVPSMARIRIGIIDNICPLSKIPLHVHLLALALMCYL